MPILLILLLILVYSTRYQKGPYWAFLIPWIVCISPVAIYLINYTYFSVWNIEFISILTMYLLTLLGGVWFYNFLVPVTNAKQLDTVTMYTDAKKWAWIAWVAGMLGTACVVIDFNFYRDGSLGDLAKIRESYISSSHVSWFARFGSVLTWGCLYSFVFSLFFRELLSRRQFLLFMAPVVGYFLTSLLTAGRQSSFQILIFVLLVQLLKPRIITKKILGLRTGWVYALVISILMMLYMGYVAVYRNVAIISIDDKVNVLEGIFKFSLPNNLTLILSAISSNLKVTFIEAVVYFSSPITLFSRFITVDIPRLYMGAISFPFLMRQLEPLTNISVVASMQAKISLMESAGVTGIGWTTAISSYIMDVGRWGAAFVLFLQGFYTAHAWNCLNCRNNFHDVVVVMVLFTIAIYMPLVSGTGETNLFLLWVFCIGISLFNKVRIFFRY